MNLNNLKLIKQIGSGGFGVVNLMEDLQGNQFALKVFHPSQNVDDDFLESLKKRFKREVSLLSGINHKNIMPILKTKLDSEPLSYLMPLCEPFTLKNIQDLKINHFYNDILKILLDVFAGVEEMHSLEIIHRDLKPQNILKYDDDYVISDFGLVSFHETQLTTLTQTGVSMGAGLYTAPEIVHELRNATFSTDIYSLGCILHDFFGTKPRLPCQTIKDYDSILASEIEICTRQNPNERFQTVQDLRQSVVEVLSKLNIYNQPKSQAVNDYLDYLSNTDTYDEQILSNFLNYLEDSAEEMDKFGIYNSVNSEIINKLKNYPVYFHGFANLYADWTRTRKHDFGKCDVIASNLEKIFLNTTNLETKSKILLALLIMGANHNRWYVENKFMKLALSSDNSLCRRFILEARVLGQQPFYAMNHIEYSISTSRNSLPLQLANFFNGVN